MCFAYHNDRCEVWDVKRWKDNQITTVGIVPENNKPKVKARLPDAAVAKHLPTARLNC